MYKKINFDIPINNDNLTSLQEKVWMVIKNPNKSNFTSDYKYVLRKNDIIKLGRIKFLISDINLTESTFSTTQNVFKNCIECQYFDSAGNNCRVCLDSGNSDDNPMICLCKCKGSNLIHLKCLSLQLHNSLEETQMNYNPGVSYTVKKYNCEICKEPYPINVKYKDQIFRLLDYSLPEKTNSIVLVSLNSIKENEYPLSVHLLIFIENSSQFLFRKRPRM